MGLSQKLILKQGQSLVMTPQLQQAIKLLQMSTLELQSFVELSLSAIRCLNAKSRPATHPMSRLRASAPDSLDKAFSGEAGPVEECVNEIERSEGAASRMADEASHAARLGLGLTAFLRPFVVRWRGWRFCRQSVPRRFRSANT